MLLDTNVIAEIQRPGGNPRVAAAVAKWRESVHLSVIVLGEVNYGLERMAPGRRRNTLLAFYAGLRADYADRILEVTEEIADLWGALTARLERTGLQLPISDGLIAATALHHAMPIMTRNVRDFAPTGARLLNPWED